MKSRMVAVLIAMMIGAPVLAAPPVHYSPQELRHAAQRYRALRHAGPNGSTGVTELRQAISVRHAYVKAPASASVSIVWTDEGPSDIGGRINAILTDPTASGHLLVGTAGGGIWQSTDAGASWTSVGDFLGSLAVSSLARAPDGTLFAGTGDQFNEPQRGVGILASTDGGTTWNVLAATNPASDRDWYYVNHIAINSNGTILVATGVPGVSPTWGGLYRSTDDGQTFVQVQSGASLDVVFDPNNASDAVAEFENGTVRYSNDGGLTWSSPVTLVSGGGRIALAFATSKPGEVYAAIDNSPGTAPSGEVYVSTDDGQTWTLAGGGDLLCTGTGSSAECQGSYDNVIWVSPTNDQRLVVGGINLFESTDGGATWTPISDWMQSPPSPHADQHAIVAVPGYSSSNRKLYVGNDGGMWSAADVSTVTATSGWSELNQGLAVTQFYSGAGHAGVQSSNNGGIVPVIGGTQDNGTEVHDAQSGNPASWTIFYGGDGGDTAVDPSDANYLYGEYVYMELFRSNNGGLSAGDLPNEPPDAESAKTANFIAPFALDPTDPYAMFAGGESLWYGTGLLSRVQNWKAINGSTLPKSQSDLLSSIGVAYGNDNDVWAGYNSGALWHSKNALGSTPTWSESGATVLPHNRPVAEIYVVPSNATTVLVAYAGRTASNLWITTDGGANWRSIGASLPPVPINTVVTDPRYPSQVIYVGTEVGLFVSLDGGQSWTASNQGPANVEINQLAWFSTSNSALQLLAATNGRGMWLGTPSVSPPSNPLPGVSALSPSTVVAGSGALTLTVTGANFVNGATVQWNGSNLSTIFVSSTKLTASVTASDVSQAQTVKITVVNPAPGGGTSSALNFTVKSAPQPNGGGGGGGGGGGTLGWGLFALLALLPFVRRRLKQR